MFTKEEYKKAINNLKLGMTQLKPDGDNCHICGDNGHQAWKCHHNPLNISYVWRNKIWECFHCGMVFLDEINASEHFGEREDTVPICKKLCSGYKVFPDGRDCEGCSDCKTNNQLVQ